MSGLIATWMLVAVAGGQPAIPRVNPRSMTEEQIAAMVAALADDDVRWNAFIALHQLPAVGARAVPALERALSSEDWQQRQMAAWMLGQLIYFYRVDYTPSDRMLRVCVEALRDDALPQGDGVFNEVDNAASALEVLTDHALRVQAILGEALGSDDGQQRFLAAAILAHARITTHLDRITAILLPHLRSDDIAGNALVATIALLKLGVEATSALEAALADADDQQRAILNYLLSRARGEADEAVQARVDALPQMGWPTRDPADWWINAVGLHWQGVNWKSPAVERE